MGKNLDQPSSGFPFGLPLPKKVAEAVKNAPSKGAKAPEELQRLLKQLTQTTGTDLLADIEVMYSPLKERFAKEFKGGTMAEAFEHFWNMEGQILRENQTFEATIPIILERSDSGRREAIGSAVLMRIENRTFLLTAAHVTDHAKNGTLLIPGRSTFIQPTGVFNGTLPPDSGNRNHDKLDAAYFWLDEECVRELHPNCKVLERPDVLLEAPEHRTTYTMAGYPWRKSRTKGRGIETNFQTFSGLEAKESEYDAMRLSRSTHIAIRFHRGNTFHEGKRRVITSPLPHGMSGGGIYVWNNEALQNSPVRLPLAGIANEYIPEKSLLIGTRLHIYVAGIFYDQPDLAALVGL